MRFIVVGLFLLAISLPASAQCNWSTLQPGQWCQVPNTRMDASVRCGDPGWNCSNPANPMFSCSSLGYLGIGAVVSTWSGGVYDSVRDKLVVWGGGHHDYCGNEIYEFDVHSLTWAQVTPADTSVTTERIHPYPSGRPASQHSYQHLVYIPSTGEFCTISLFGIWPEAGGLGIWCNNPSGRNLVNQGGLQGWADRTPTNYYYPNVCTGNVAVDYDPDTDRVYIDTGPCGNGNRLAVWNPHAPPSSSLTFPYPRQSGQEAYYANGVIDPVNNVMVHLGAGGGSPYTLWSWNLTNGARVMSTAGQLATPPPACNIAAPGWSYDSAIGKFVAWCGGATTYTYNRAGGGGQGVWSTCAATSGVPSNPVQTGTYGRWQYVPDYDGFVLVNSTKENVWIYKLPANCSAGAPAQCADGADNDGDGETDLADSGCSNSSDTDESNCGDGVCEGGETTTSCAADCGTGVTVPPLPPENLQAN